VIGSFHQQDNDSQREDIMAVKVDLPSVKRAYYARTKGKMLGEGCFRTVYGTPNSKWAYKFEGYAMFKKEANNVEMKVYSSMKNRMPQGIRLPEMVMLSNGVIAVERIDGYHPYECDTYSNLKHDENCPGKIDINNCWFKQVNRLGFSDMHNGNVLVKDGILYVIDMGNGSKEIKDSPWE
jgi:RIO-like serine/threonine protein kinase